LGQFNFISLEEEFQASHTGAEFLELQSPDLTQLIKESSNKELQIQPKGAIPRVEKFEEEDRGLDIANKGLGFNSNHFNRHMTYGLLAISFLGICGLHRFYLQKPKTGILFLFTFGLFGLGTIFDVLTINILIKHAEDIVKDKKTHWYPLRMYRKVVQAEIRYLVKSINHELHLMILAIVTLMAELITIVMGAFTFGWQVVWKAAKVMYLATIAAVIESVYIIVDALYQLVWTTIRAARAILQSLYFAIREILLMVYHSCVLSAKAIWRADGAILKGWFNIIKVQFTTLSNIITAGFFAIVLKGFQIVDAMIRAVFRLLRVLF